MGKILREIIEDSEGNILNGSGAKISRIGKPKVLVMYEGPCGSDQVLSKEDRAEGARRNLPEGANAYILGEGYRCGEAIVAPIQYYKI